MKLLARPRHKIEAAWRLLHPSIHLAVANDSAEVALSSEFVFLPPARTRGTQKRRPSGGSKSVFLFLTFIIYNYYSYERLECFQAIHLSLNKCSFKLFRFQDQNYGKQSVHVCVVKKVANEKLLFNFFVQKPLLTNQNIER